MALQQGEEISADVLVFGVEDHAHLMTCVKNIAGYTIFAPPKTLTLYIQYFVNIFQNAI